MFKNILKILLSVIFLVSCSNSTDPDYNQYYDSLSNLDYKAAIAKGNEWHYSVPKIKTYVTTKEAVFEFPDGRVVKKSLPNDLFYMAVAPFVNGTHTCETHYPSSCDGEMKEKQFTVSAVDENENSVFNGNITSLKNGFIELWLPRNKNIKLSISYSGLNGTETLPTKDDSRTCITTIRLK